MQKIGNMKVGELLADKIEKVQKDISIEEVIDIFNDNDKANIIAVFDGDAFVGQILKVDLLKLLVNTQKIALEEITGLGFSFDFGYFAKTAEDIVTNHGVDIKEDELIEDAAWKMLQNDVRSLVVFDKDDNFFGILRDSDIFEMLLEEKNKKQK